MCITICCVCFEYKMRGTENKGIQGIWVSYICVFKCCVCKGDSTHASPYRLYELMIIGGGGNPGIRG